MCGLFGATLDNFDEVVVNTARRARDSLTHRGPDQSGEWITNNIYMGQRRLSILDLSEAGRQPMVSRDAKIGITVNGEIYNFKNIRKELESIGYIFLSNSDSEVVLHGYRQWGIEGLAQRLDGMYVAIIHDVENNVIHAFRDRVGIKPLYYYHDGKSFAWASELKALNVWLPAHKRSVDETSLYDFLIYRYIPAPKSLYKNVFKLLPGHILGFKISSGTLSIKPYWELPVTETDKPAELLAEELIGLLQESVKEQMVSDVPVGFLLSGGIDSSIITLTGAKLSANPMTFSIGFHDPSRDESEYARIVSEIASTRHHVHKLDSDEMENLPDKMAAWFDEPFCDTSAVPTYRVCAFARRNVTVALSGDGGDELFGGYRWYEDFSRLRNFSSLLPALPVKGICFPGWLPRQRSLYLRSIGDPLFQYASLRGSLDVTGLGKWRKKLAIPEDYDGLWAYRKHFRPDTNIRKCAQIIDFHTYLPDDILTKVDRVSMAVSLECRPPFLSNKMIDFAFSLKEDFLYKNQSLKGGLKYAYHNLLPEKILQRPKQGFSVPYTEWKTNIRKSSGSLQEAIIEKYL